MDVDNHKTIRSVLIGISKKAIDGDLSLEEFIELWPSKADSDPFYLQIYEDIEDGIEHLPGFLFKKGINYKAWVDSISYLIIYLDHTLLECDRNTNELVQCRNKVRNEIGSSIFSKESITNRVHQLLGP